MAILVADLVSRVAFGILIAGIEDRPVVVVDYQLVRAFLLVAAAAEDQVTGSIRLLVYPLG